MRGWSSIQYAICSLTPPNAASRKFSVVHNDEAEFVHLSHQVQSGIHLVKCHSGYCQAHFYKSTRRKLRDLDESACPHIRILHDERSLWADLDVEIDCDDHTQSSMEEQQHDSASQSNSVDEDVEEQGEQSPLSTSLPEVCIDNYYAHLVLVTRWGYWNHPSVCISIYPNFIIYFRNHLVKFVHI